VRGSTPILLVVLLFLGITAPASADTYCVGSSGCDHDNGSDLQQALTDAGGHPGPDTVRIGAGAFSKPGGFTYNNADPVAIQGAGGGNLGPAGTRLVDSAGSNPTGHTVLSVRGSSASTISGVEVNVPEGTGGNNIGISTNGAIRNVLVRAAPPASFASIAVSLENGGSLSDSDIRMAIDSFSQGVQVLGVGTVVSDSRIEATSGYVAGGSGSPSGTVQAVDMVIALFGISVARGDIHVDEAVIRTRSSPGLSPTAASVSTSGANATLTLNHASIVGGGNPNGRALVASAVGGGRSDVTLRNGVITGYPVVFDRSAAAGSVATITTDYSSYGGTTAQDTGSGSIAETNHIDVPPGFLSGTDFHLRPDSALIDAGDPAGLAAGELTTDLANQPRIIDGNGDCVARRDIGAYEFTPGPRAPEASVIATPGQATIGQQVAFGAGFSCDPDGDEITYAWSFDDGGTATGASVQHAFSTAGLHAGTVTVRDSTGRTSTATALVRVSRSPVPFAGVSIPKQNVKVSKKGVAKVKVRCPAAARGRCSGTLKLAAKLRKRKTIGSKAFSIKPGATGAVNVKLSKAARGRLRKNHRLNATATATAKDASGLTKVGAGTLVLSFRK
jgi:PKD repeat protein